MRMRGIGIGVVVLARCAALVAADAADEDEIRRILAIYHQGVQAADTSKVASVTSAKAWGVSPGGTAGMGMADRARTRSRARSTMIRRVDFVNDHTAVALGVWRDFSPAPFGTGTVQYTLVREAAGWRIAHRHDAYLPELRQIASAAPAQTGGNANEWESLFDGRTFAGWIGTDSESGPATSWKIENGILLSLAGTGRCSLMTERQYLNFELQFEWMVAARGNSGVKYRLLGFDRLGGLSREALGFEYQVADDVGDPGARADPKQRSGALYAHTPVAKPLANPPGEWNEGRILVYPDHVEHWLNGQLAARHAVDVPFASAIVLQHHLTEVRFRNIRIRQLGADAAER